MRVIAVLIATALAGCGDNSKQCGDGTTDDDGDGLCEAPLPLPPCGDGTRLDELTNTCVIDPAVCADGTVLIRGQCRDPSGDLVVNLIEGPEPNGFEGNATPAGTIAVPSAGADGFVIHGCVKPLDNNTPDFDVYEFVVGGPTLLHIAADGIQGLAAGFQITADFVDPLLAGWQRLGIDVATDTSQREVFLPTAGAYLLVMTDSRTLLPITTGGEGSPAAGNLDGTSCYYVTIDQKPLPPATPVSTAGHTGMIADNLVFFSGPFPSASTDITAVIDPETPPTVDSRAASSLVLLNNTVLVEINDGDAVSPVSQLTATNIQVGDDALLVLDYVFNIAVAPAPFQITVVP